MKQLSSTVRTQISDYVTHYAQQTPEVEAVVCGGRRITYLELEEQVCQCAKALLAHGIDKGDRIAVLCTPKLEYWVLFLATTRIGAVWLGLNPKYKLQETRYVLEDARPTLLFTLSKFEGRSYQNLVDTVNQDYAFVGEVIELPESVSRNKATAQSLSGTMPYRDFFLASDCVADKELTERQASIDAMDPALLVYTSGSTGKPKGALISHYGLCFGASVQHAHYGIQQPKMLCSFPINHVACVADTCCLNLVAGGTLIFQARFDAAAVLKALKEEQITVLLAVPTMLLMLLEHPDFDPALFESLQLIAWGGAALPLATIKQLQTLAPRLMNVYGLTETAANTTYTSINADLIELSETIGRPSPHMPCRIVDAEGKQCAVGEEGELQFKGEYLLLEYLNRPEATRDVYTDDGWLHTGDLGYWREEGTITLVGRMSDMYKSGGYNVYPREIENLLESHPAVELAAVVGVPDDRFQEVGAAFVVSAHPVDVAQLKAHCVKHLANYKIPKTFTLVDQLPTLPVGKVDKVALKQRALARQVETASV